MQEQTKLPAAISNTTSAQANESRQSRRDLVIVLIGRAACRLLSTHTLTQPCNKLFLPSIPRPSRPYSHGSWYECYQKETEETLQLLSTPHKVKLPENITKPLQAGKKIIVIAGLGRHTGSVGAVALASYLQRHQIPAHLLCSTPFDFEGNTCARIAEKTLANLPANLPATVFSLEELETAHPDISSSRFFQVADKIMMNMLKKVLTFYT